MLSTLLLCLAVSNSLHLATGQTDALTSWMSKVATAKPNVLFLVADDLRPWLGCYGAEFMKTPNIDQLASKSVRFDRAYVQQSVCGPSRSSFMTGRRPETTRVLDLETYWRTAGGNFTTIAQYFKEHGYVTHGIGKILHKGRSSGGTYDHPYSWTQRFDEADATLEVQEMDHSFRGVPEKGGVLQDTNIANHAINFINTNAVGLSQRGIPFFLAVGFKKPHLPFLYPEKYDALYSELDIPLGKHRGVPTGVTQLELKGLGELKNYKDIKALQLSPPDYIVPDSYQRKLRKGYAAATSYTDAMLGRVVAALNEAGLADNTIITFISDHGFQLGENAQWTKHNNFDISVRIPMTVHVPGVTDSVTGNPSTRQLVEAVDLFPTLTELAGLPVPSTCPEDSSNIATCVEGTSLVPVIRQATGLSGDAAVPWKDAAFSLYPRTEKRGRAMGYTMRTDQYRYTEWVAFDQTEFIPDYSTVYARELYVHDTGDATDPDPEEHYNRADDPEYQELVRRLSLKLQGGWRGVLDRYKRHTEG